MLNRLVLNRIPYRLKALIMIARGCVPATKSEPESRLKIAGDLPDDRDVTGGCRKTLESLDDQEGREFCSCPEK